MNVLLILIPFATFARGLLTNVKYNKSDIKTKLDELGKAHPELAVQIDDVSKWLTSEMEG